VVNGEVAAHVTGDGTLAAGLRSRGVLEGAPEDGLVLDASAAQPGSWAEVEAALLEVFQLSRRAMIASAPIVYVVDGPAVYGHARPLPAALATAMLGGARSLAVEGARAGTPVHAVTTAAGADAADAVEWLLRSGPPSGQLVHCDPTHVGRPAA
jgi:hypothetical protein